MPGWRCWRIASSTSCNTSSAPDLAAFWAANGGLAQFGYPLTEEFTEILEDGRAYTVQYFERARFERHPENPAPYDILLGHFGRHFYARSLLSPRGNAPTCRPEDLTVTITAGGAGGSTYVQVTLQNTNNASCHLGGFLRPTLFDGDGGELPVTLTLAPSFNGTQTQSSFVLRPGQTAGGMLKWANSCPSDSPIDPDPAAKLGISLPDGSGLWFLAHGGPRCGAHGTPKGITSAALSLGFDDHLSYLAFTTLEAYFLAISHGSYQSAFSLLSPELRDALGPYDRFAAGFAGTKYVTLAITGYQPLGDQTTRLFVRLAARQTDGTARYYLGTYDLYAFPDPAKPVLTSRIVGANMAEEFR